MKFIDISTLFRDQKVDHFGYVSTNITSLASRCYIKIISSQFIPIDGCIAVTSAPHQFVRKVWEGNGSREGKSSTTNQPAKTKPTKTRADRRKKREKEMRDTLISSHLLTIMMIAVVSLHQQFIPFYIFNISLGVYNGWMCALYYTYTHCTYLWMWVWFEFWILSLSLNVNAYSIICVHMQWHHLPITLQSLVFK